MKKVVITAIVLVVAVCSITGSLAVYRINGFVAGRRAFWQGYGLMNQADYSKAIPFFSDCLRKPDEQSWRATALANRGYCYYQLGQYDKAIDDMTASLQIEPRGTSYQWRGLAYGQKNRSDLAFADYEKALQFDPNLPGIWYREGLYYENAGNYQSARTAFREAIRSYPDYVDAYIESGYSSSHLGDRDGAISSYDAAIQINPKSAFAFGARGRFYLDEKLPDRAVSDLTKAIQLAPEEKRYRCDRSVAFELLYRFRDEIEDLSCALELDPRDEWARQRRGLAYREQKDFPRAIADFSEFIKLTQSADAYNDRARAYAQAGQYPLALADYKTEKHLARGKVRTWSKLMAWFLATCPDSTYRDGAEAVAEATKDCEATRWSDPSDLDTMAAAKAEIGQFDEAASYEEKAMALLEPDSGWEKNFTARLALYRARKPFRDEPRR